MIMISVSRNKRSVHVNISLVFLESLALHFVLVEQLERNFEMYDQQLEQQAQQQANTITQPVNINQQTTATTSNNELSVFSQDDTDQASAFSGVLADSHDSTTVRVIACESEEDDEMDQEITPVTVHLHTPTRRSHSLE